MTVRSCLRRWRLRPLWAQPVQLWEGAPSSMLVFLYDTFQTLAVFVLACRLRQPLALQPTPMLQLLCSSNASPASILAMALVRYPAPNLTAW